MAKSKQRRSDTGGRPIKRQFPRTEFLKVRISKEYKELLAVIKAEHRRELSSDIFSDADVIESALHVYANHHYIEIPFQSR